jgi:hypothetical protein
METIDEKVQKIRELWVDIDHWEALCMQWNIDNPYDKMPEMGLFKATHLDVMHVFDLVINSPNDVFGVSMFGMTVQMAEALNYLCGAIRVLDHVFTLHDGGIQYDLSLRDVSDAYSGELIHPETGKPVEDWKNHVTVNYKLTDEMKRLKDDYKSRI